MKTAWTLCTVLTLAHACEKAYFGNIPGHINAQNVEYQIQRSTKKSCLRTCRQHAECYAFNMLWDGLSGLGSCQILSWKDSRHTDQLQPHSGATYFYTCPGRMVWNPDNAHCYEMIEETKSFDDAVVHCANLYPGSHLVDLTSEQENQFVTNMSMPLIANKPFHIAAKRDSVGAAFVWNSTAQAVTYTDWLNTYPTTSTANKDCVYISYTSSRWGWGNWACAAQKYFICEF